jgi:hypothetical protein
MVITLFIVCGILSIISTALLILVLIGQNKIDTYERWIVEFRDDVTDVYTQLKKIDEQNVFERDDEVGVVFLDIVTLISKLNTRIQYDVNIKKETQEEN